MRNLTISNGTFCVSRLLPIADNGRFHLFDDYPLKDEENPEHGKLLTAGYRVLEGAYVWPAAEGSAA